MINLSTVRFKDLQLPQVVLVLQVLMICRRKLRMSNRHDTIDKGDKLFAFELCSWLHLSHATECLEDDVPVAST